MGMSPSIMQYGLLNDLPQNNCLRCNSFIDLIYILVVKIAPKIISDAVKTSIKTDMLVIRRPFNINIQY